MLKLHHAVKVTYIVGNAVMVVIVDIVAADKLAGTNAVTETLFFKILRKSIIEFFVTANIFDDKLAVRGVLGKDSNSAETEAEHSLSKGTAHLEVGNAIEHYFIKLLGYEALFDQKLFIGNRVNGERKGKTEKAGALTLFGEQRNLRSFCQIMFLRQIYFF